MTPEQAFQQAFQQALALSRKYTKETAEGMGAVKGEDGSTPVIGTNGNWYIDGVDTGSKAIGENGITPSIDPETKHWMIGNTDTGVVAEGINGTDGKNGFSPSITVKTDTDAEYILIINSENGSFETPNLKGGGGTDTGNEPEIDLSGYAKKEDIPTKTSELENDSGFVTRTELDGKGYLADEDFPSYDEVMDILNEEEGVA